MGKYSKLLVVLDTLEKPTHFYAWKPQEVPVAVYEGGVIFQSQGSQMSIPHKVSRRTRLEQQVAHDSLMGFSRIDNVQNGPSAKLSIHPQDDQGSRAFETPAQMW